MIIHKKFSLDPGTEVFNNKSIIKYLGIIIVNLINPVSKTILASVYGYKYLGLLCDVRMILFYSAIC